MSDQVGNFGAKLDLALRLLNISRGRLAAEAQVDKSLVSRWARGITAPRGHNLAVITDIVRARAPQFTQLTWDLPLDAFARELGQTGEAPPPGPATTPPIAKPAVAQPAEGPGALASSRAQSAFEMQREGHAYPGVYLAFRQAFRNTGQLVSDLIVLWRQGDRMFFRQFDPAFSHVGEVFLLRHQLFMVGEDDQRVDGLIYYLLNGVTGQKAVRSDGLFMTVLNDRDRTPSATSIVFQRLLDLEDPETPPDDEVLIPIVEKTTALFRAGRLAELAGPDILAAITPKVGPPGPAEGFDWLLRRPQSRTLTATEMEWSGTLEAEIRNVRREILGRDDCFPVFDTQQGPDAPWPGRRR